MLCVSEWCTSGWGTSVVCEWTVYKWVVCEWTMYEWVVCEWTVQVGSV